MSSVVRVTLGIPTHNCDHCLADAIRSGLAPDFPPARLRAAVSSAGPVGLL